MKNEKTDYSIKDAESLDKFFQNLNQKMDRQPAKILDTFTQIGLWTAALTTLVFGVFTNHNATALLAVPLVWIAVLFDDLK